VGDGAGIALTLEADLGVVDRPGSIGQQHQLEIDALGRHGVRFDKPGQNRHRRDKLSHPHLPKYRRAR
jgi:hypothetical protein